MFIKILADFDTYKILAFSFPVKIPEGLEFFISNISKVFIMVLIVGFFIGLIREFITPEKTRKILSNKKTGIGNLISSFLAVVTPVEEFSIIPVFIGFLEAGIPSSIAFTYLITAPITNELAFAIFWSLFGYKIALLYYTAGIIIGLTGGIIIGALNPDKYIQPLIAEEKIKLEQKPINKNFKEIINAANQKSLNFFKSFWLYIFIGVGIAAIIHGYVPTNHIIQYVGIDNPFAIPLSVILVILFYVNISMVLPIIMIFINYSLPIGTIMAFIMAVTATSIPELMILKRALKLPLLLIYMGILLGLIIFTGYLFNFIFKTGLF